MASQPKTTAEKTSNAWEILKLIATGAVAGIAALVGSYLTYTSTMTDLQLKYDNLDRVAELQNATANKDLDLRMVDLSLAILAGEKGGTDEKDTDGYRIARDFAIKALSKASGIPVSDTDREIWAKAGALPLAPVEPNENAATNTLVYDNPEKTILTVCIGEFFDRCPMPTKNHFTCGTDMATISALACPSTSTTRQLVSVGGNRCGYSMVEITCT